MIHMEKLRIKTILFASAMLLAPLGAGAQTEVSEYVPGVTPEGITYFLPKTELRIRVTATCVKYTPGDFRPYAERYLRLSDIPKEASSKWNINDVKIYAVGIPDEAKAFSVKLNPKTPAPLVSLTKAGVLMSINAQTKEPEAIPAAPKPVVKDESLNSRDYMTQEILAAGSVAKQAELTAAEIYDIRESRSALVKGEADNMPKDGEQLKLMISNLDTQERALLQLFKGTEKVETRTFDYVYVPSEDKEEVLFRFSSKLGPVDADDLAGEPVYISIKDKHTVAAPAPAPEKKKKEIEDVRYNVPSQVDVAVSFGGKSLAAATFPMGQFGNVEHLGAELFNKKMDTQVFLNPVTGGIDKLTLPEPK